MDTDEENSCNWKLDHLHNPPFINIFDNITNISHEAYDFYNNLPVSSNVVSNNDGSITSTTSICDFHIINGPSTDGNIYIKDNIQFLNTYISHTLSKLHTLGYNNSNSSQDNKKIYVDLVTADGGLEEAMNSNIQENICMQLIVCQIIAMLGNLKIGGKFILKLFTTFLNFLFKRQEYNFV